jgi:hypothetical protein
MASKRAEVQAPVLPKKERERKSKTRKQKIPLMSLFPSTCCSRFEEKLEKDVKLAGCFSSTFS